MADAEAICEAVTRANMRFVATKTARATERPDAPSHPPSVHPSADISNQCDPTSPCGVWHCRAGRAQGRRPRAPNPGPHGAADASRLRQALRQTAKNDAVGCMIGLSLTGLR